MEKTNPSLVEWSTWGAAARTENYEIAAYEGLRRMAKGLGENRAVTLLDENLADEKAALREVEKIATRGRQRDGQGHGLAPCNTRR